MAGRNARKVSGSWCHKELNRRDKKRLLIYTGIALIASGTILMILLYTLVYWHTTKTMHENINTSSGNQVYTLPNGKALVEIFIRSTGGNYLLSLMNTLL
jgi:hypothetical protein